MQCYAPSCADRLLVVLPNSSHQGFNWESSKEAWYKKLALQADEIAAAGFTAIWFPPASDSVSPQVSEGGKACGAAIGWSA